MKTIPILLTLVFTAQLAFAQTYKWVDEKGVAHFTDDITQVPEKYQSKAERMVLPEHRGTAQEVTATPPKEKEELYRDRLGRGEEYWKGRVEEWKKKLLELQEKVEALRVKYNQLTERFNASKSSAERVALRGERDQVKGEMDQYRIQIAEAKEMLEKKIPEEAQLYKAKPEWTKP